MLQRVSLLEMAMTEFATGSIGLILTSTDRADASVAFTGDLLHDNGVARVFLSGSQLREAVVAMREHGLDFDDAYQLDFDDAYQYVAATSRNQQLVSFDTDFDRTDLGRLEPKDGLDRIR